MRVPTLAEALAGGMRVEQGAADRPRTSRIHRLAGNEDSPAQIKVDVLRLLHERPGLTRRALADELKVDIGAIESVISMLVKKREIHGAKGEGYRLGSGVITLEDSMAKKPTAPSVTPTDIDKPRKKRKYPKRAKVRTGKAAAANGAPAGFIVDDYGRVTICGANARIELNIADTKRLVSFLDRSKAFRS